MKRRQKGDACTLEILISVRTVERIGGKKMVRLNEVENAVNILSKFIEEECETASAVLILPDGTGLFTDWGYFIEGLEEFQKYFDDRRRHGGEKT